MQPVRYLLAALAAISLAVGSSIGSAAPVHGPAPMRIGAIYPLSGPQGAGGQEEYHGLQIAAKLVNAAGGVHGRPITFVTANAPSADAAPAAVDSLKRQGVSIVAGSYGSTISIPASAEAQRQNLIFWESGAVATMITEHGYPNVFRTVTTGNSLGRAAARYAATVISPRLRLTPSKLRTVVVYVNDVYGSSVGKAMADQARAQGFNIRGVLTYDPYHMNMPALIGRMKLLRPDVVLVAAYVQDAITLRREVLRQGVHPAAMVGTSSAFCMHAFGDTLGQKALGLFASDKPDATFSANALLPSARALRTRATQAYQRAYGVPMTASAVAGFVAGWTLFHNVLPHARSEAPADVRRAALAVNLPNGSEINGAGIRFAGPGAPDEGQNLRAISVIWQWQTPGHEVVVYPASYATAHPLWIPLPGWKHS
jgi:branched-chain amino acid transport system substrate-binding protein